MNDLLAIAEERECLCKVCGHPTDTVLEHRIRPWYSVVEFVCQDCVQWAVDTVSNRMVDLLNQGAVLPTLPLSPWGSSQVP